ncbi:MAG: nucleotidyltransferase domain-containing protein [Methanomicrobiales archaeon]|jgi:predicted nucleotidyltransferase|nr:nucleotidyltransferase domain-containing protein [Methanomicrobiales archaeon]
MLTHEEIVKAVAKAATQFSLKKVAYFGSYADGSATEESDLDVLVEFYNRPKSLLTVIGLKCWLEDEMSVPVDLIEIPLPEKARIKIGKTVPVYERT